MMKALQAGRKPANIIKLRVRKGGLPPLGFLKKAL